MATLLFRKNQSTPKSHTGLGVVALFQSAGLVGRVARLTATTTAASVFCLMAGQTAFADNARINGFSLHTDAVYQFNEINITSSSGERWDTIEPGTIKFSMHGRLDTKWPGVIGESGVFLGDCANQQCANYPILEPSEHHAGKRDLNFNKGVSFSTSRIPIAGPNVVMLSDFGQRAAVACNAGADDGPREAKSFFRPMTISFSVNTQKALKTTRFAGAGDETFGGGDTTQRSSFPVKVNCVPYASMVEGADPVEVDITVDKPYTNVCPATGTVRTRIVYHYPKTASFNIKRNGKVVKTVEIKAKKVALSHGPDQWVIDRHDKVDVEGGENVFRIKVKGGGQSKAARFNHNCAKFDVLFSDLKYNVVNTKSCPKKVYETASFITNGPGEATYQLVQESGNVFYEKKLKTIFKNGQYKLVGQRVLDIPKAFEGKFKAQIKGKSGVNTGWKTLKVECPAIVSGAGAGAAGGLTTAPTPSHSAEDTPKVLVAPLPTPRKPVVATPTVAKPAIKTAPVPKKDEEAAKRAKEREAEKQAAARKAAAKKAAAKKAAAKKAAAKKAAAKKAAAKKAAVKKAAVKKAAAKKAAAKKATKRANAKKKAKRANVRKCKKGKTLVRGKCIKPAG